MTTSKTQSRPKSVNTTPEPVRIRAFEKPLDIRLTQEPMQLPLTLRDQVEHHWRALIERKPRMHNGEVFAVTRLWEDDSAIHLRLAETDYAHYMYSNETPGLGEYAVQVIHPAALILTSDNQAVLGVMAEHTSRAGMIQFCGGGLDRRAVRADGVIDIDQIMTVELEEELGVNMHDPRQVVSAAPAYLKTGGPLGKMTLVYKIVLAQTGEEVRRHYAQFEAKLQASGGDMEFDEVLLLDCRPEAVEAFIEQYESRLSEYVGILLRIAAELAASTHSGK